MTDIVTQVDVERSIEEICDRLDELVEEYATLAEHAGAAEATYRVRLAKNYLARRDAHRGEGRAPSDKECESRAIVAVENELRERNRAAALAESCKQAIYSHRARLEALRSLNANVREATR